ncbi:sugar phosphate isomerase/epimerase family protein [Botrimarina hoheduenensis]|uniref:Xylose isomerase-like TIM barrel n=1 Tax=Botrimarina hoheduenensis TaxID=2528000 RepID=A0A5C5W8H1_9BACT|nr:sugar phosphate isomerase/epimerase [Botrimarina hoheduenensis]TWT46553.1 Xylose isomerase-like TIM barrel [Botrimarina hoheduenensis]
MFICASTECLPDVAADEVLEVMVDLGFTSVELALHETGGWLRPSQVLADPEAATLRCSSTRRLDVAALSLGIEAEGEAFYEQFDACAKLAKAIKVVTLVVPASPLGTPFNEEIERLKRLVAIAAFEGAVVALKTGIGTMTEDADTAALFCQHVKGLGLTFDPSCYLAGPHQGKPIDKLLEFVRHVHLRDSKPNAFQVRVGQGDIDYGKLIAQLSRTKYRRALGVHMTPMEEFEHRAELRKLRLLLESLL